VHLIKPGLVLAGLRGPAGAWCRVGGGMVPGRRGTAPGAGRRAAGAWVPEVGSIGGPALLLAGRA